jgi:hypothetical protein
MLSDTVVEKHPFALEISTESTTALAPGARGHSVGDTAVTATISFALPTMTFSRGLEDTSGSPPSSFLEHEQGSRIHPREGKPGTLLEQIANTRAGLLARLYVQNALSKEESARLAIADAQIGHLVPRVTEAQITSLRTLKAELEELRRGSDIEWSDLDI